MSLTIAEAAQRLGLAVDTLRYYEKDGLLLRAVPRSSAGHRRYGDEDLRWIELITRLRATGMPIREVRRYADLVRGGTGNERERLELLHAHREAVLAQLAEAQTHLAAIEYKIDLYTERLGAEYLSA
ncbi:MerR family transcriptional regulator [Ruania rhizosphaerae]|uniref:MerR family transcriptional regulator n=1 Tax=Ruania rhizosphaerae TaxID=1840413 RepID=UPI001357CD44|nr:MerR family transcriptional regulator [Ruania rhizosphaerae]